MKLSGVMNNQNSTSKHIRSPVLA